MLESAGVAQFIPTEPEKNIKSQRGLNEVLYAIIKEKFSKLEKDLVEDIRSAEFRERIKERYTKARLLNALNMAFTRRIDPQKQNHLIHGHRFWKK